MVNVDLFGIEYEHRIALHNFYHSVPPRQILIGLLTAGTNREPSEIDHVSCTTEDDLIWKLQVCSVVVMDCSRIKLDIASVVQHRISVHIAILLNSTSNKLVNALLLAGALCVIQINQCYQNNLNTFLHKIINGATVEDCVSEIDGTRLRIYGNRCAKGYRDELSLWRKAVLANYDNKLPHTGDSKFAELLTELTELSSSRRTRLMNVMASNNSHDIHMFINELEGEFEQCANNDASSLSNDPNAMIESTSSKEIAKLFSLSKRIFQDHLYGTNSVDFVRFKDDHLSELMKSFATKEREGKRRNRKKKAVMTRGCWSEGEGSRRSSFSEGNTDTEAVVIDMELER
ncbi:unnamed protein product [Toxocara canis]|uniref:ORC4_C domain-containing protein n=1 Tax=Toxocara canis TaxID=6265 RepID=A0A183TZD9_TOXCA|nr:unnamed protein product [Toxocara canis]